MKRNLLFLPALLFVLALTLAACGSDGEAPSTTAADSGQATDTPATQPNEPEPPPAPPPRTGTEIKVADSEYGPIIWDGNDQAVYLFDAETTSTPACYGSCAEAWPPVLTEGRPQAGGGAKLGLLGTTKRRDGSTQVTYNGHPLYYYDEPPGVVECHDVFEFGGLWLVVDGAGDAVS